MLTDLMYLPEHVAATRSRECRESIGGSFVIARPWHRFPVSPVRRANIVFNFAETLWYMAARDDAGYLAYYAPAIHRYSGDGQATT